MSPRVVKAPDVRREEIVAAARGLFAERGVRATTFQDVAERVGVTRGLVYHYAADMGTLVDQVLETCIAEFVTDLRTWDEAREVGNIDQADGGIGPSVLRQELRRLLCLAAAGLGYA